MHIAWPSAPLESVCSWSVEDHSCPAWVGSHGMRVLMGSTLAPFFRARRLSSTLCLYPESRVANFILVIEQWMHVSQKFGSVSLNHLWFSVYELTFRSQVFCCFIGMALTLPQKAIWVTYFPAIYQEPLNLISIHRDTYQTAMSRPMWSTTARLLCLQSFEGCRKDLSHCVYAVRVCACARVYWCVVYMYAYACTPVYSAKSRRDRVVAEAALTLY